MEKELKQNTEEEEIAYPIYCKLKHSSLVVKFTELQSGEVAVDGKCYKCIFHSFFV